MLMIPECSSKNKTKLQICCSLTIDSPCPCPCPYPSSYIDEYEADDISVNKENDNRNGTIGQMVV